MLQNDSHLNCLCVMVRLIEALAIYMCVCVRVPYVNTNKFAIVEKKILKNQNPLVG